MTEREEIIEDINIQKALEESWTRRGSEEFVLKEVERREIAIARLQNEILVLYDDQKKAATEVTKAKTKIVNLQDKLHALSVKPELTKLKKLQEQLKDCQEQIALLKKEKE